MLAGDELGLEYTAWLDEKDTEGAFKRSWGLAYRHLSATDNSAGRVAAAVASDRLGCFPDFFITEEWTAKKEMAAAAAAAASDAGAAAAASTLKPQPAERCRWLTGASCNCST
jgi:hypothetical protein